MSAVWESSTHSGGTLLVLLALADFSDDDGRCWPSQDTLARKARLSVRQVRSCLNQLIESGEIEVLRPGNGRKSTIYRVLATRAENISAQGGKSCRPGRKPTSAKPSIEPSKKENTYVAENGDGSAQKAQIEELHEHFNTERQSQDPSRRALKLTDDRRRKYRARLRTYSVDEIRRAITAALADPFYRGKNEQSTRYDFPETVLKNDGAVDRHLDQGDGKREARKEQLQETGNDEWGKLVALAKRDLPADELRNLLSPAARESYLAVKTDLERALVEDLDLRPVRDRFLAAYSERGARGP